MIRHFLSLASFSPADISALLDRSQFFSENHQHPEKIVHLLRHRVLANAFYEPSTRTRCSFEIAAKRLGAEVVNFIPENSSAKKGESVYDTLKTLESLGTEAVILRHADDHIFEGLRDALRVPMINAGAGKFEHPTQGLLDLLTLRQEFGRLEGLKIAICGDIRHSRVAGSMIVAAEKFGMQVLLSGPDSLVPELNKDFVRKVAFDEALPQVDAVMLLRIQLERHESLELDSDRYRREFGLTEERLGRMQRRAIVMHPGPFNRDVEIASNLVEHSQSRIFKQMANGVFARMAILEWVLRGGA
jgi:aspartate carbamoyltransferase catalytic subunit